MLLKIVFGLAIALVFQFCYCDEHKYGDVSAGDKVLLEKVLFDQSKEENDVKTKNYTIIFKYIGADSSPNVSSAVFNVENAKSFGTVEVVSEPGKEKNVQVMLNVVNGTNVKITGKIYGPSVNVFNSDMLKQIAQSNQRTIPKTMTVIYGHNSTKTRNRKVILGHRQQGDRMIQFESKNVTYTYRFAETEFKYHNDKQYVTAIAFSFDSPTAIAFLNSTFIDEHGVDAIVYDLNMPIFQANMSVFGYEHFDKPSTYVPIVSARNSQT